MKFWIPNIGFVESHRKPRRRYDWIDVFCLGCIAVGLAAAVYIFIRAVEILTWIK